MPEEEKKEEEKKEKKDENKVVLEVHMHCDACQKKVHNAVMGYPGVESIEIDMKGQKLTVKGKIDAKKFFETVKKKSGGKATKILYPEPKKDDGKKEEKKDEKKKDEKKKEPADVTVVLKVHVHCGACAKKVHKVALAIEGVYSANVEGDKVTIKGKDLDPKEVCATVAKKSGRHAEIVPPKKDEKKEDKKDEKKDDKKDEKKDDKKDGKEDSKKDGKKDDGAKKDDSTAIKVTAEYVYPPQYFSDENPNACRVM